MLSLNPRDTVMTNAAKLATIGGGGTNCSAPIVQLVAREGQGRSGGVRLGQRVLGGRAAHGGGTGLMQAWEKLKAINPQAKLVCIDIQPYTTTQAAERADILNVGGFSDAVFEVIANFAKGQMGADHWVGEIEKIEL